MHLQLTLLAVPARPPLIDENTRRIGRRGLKEARKALQRPTPSGPESRPAAA